jgi:hypothetical protein
MVSRHLEVYDSIEKNTCLTSSWLLESKIELVINIAIDAAQGLSSEYR